MNRVPSYTFGQAPAAGPCQPMSPEGYAKGPIDLNCAQYNQFSNECTECLNEQAIMNGLVRIDNPYMWTHRIIPGAVVGIGIGIGVGYLIWRRK